MLTFEFHFSPLPVTSLIGPLWFWVIEIHLYTERIVIDSGCGASNGQNRGVISKQQRMKNYLDRCIAQNRIPGIQYNLSKLWCMWIIKIRSVSAAIAAAVNSHGRMPVEHLAPRLLSRSAAAVPIF
jgi:hypothetical protein